jgi:hypothetical protein
MQFNHWYEDVQGNLENSTARICRLTAKPLWHLQQKV